MQRPSNQSHCFVSARWHSTDGIIVITTDCQVLLLSNFSLDALAHCLSISDTSSLLSLRNRIQITFYSFSSYFSSITCMVPVLFCFYSHGQESADTLLLGGIGETALIRVTFQPNRKILRNCVPSSSLHSSGNSFHSVRIHVHFCSHHGGKCVSSSWREFLPGFIFPLIGHRIDPLFATSKPTIFGHPANRIFPPTLHRFVVVRIVFPPSCRFFLSRNGADFGREETAPRYRQTESPLEDVSTVFPPSGELAGTVFGASFFPPIRSRSFIGPSFPSRRNSHYPRRNRGGDGSLDSRQQLAHCAICAM